jgi:methyltransferase (TIGR00027 family)
MSAPRGLASVSDTALWVAVYRALETQRPDALFKDPYADRLAGPRGREIVDSIPKGRQTAWPLIVRTAVLDELILARVAAGADAVLNLAAGLDTRPYRLDLPPGLTWVEADLPAMIAYKEQALSGDAPRCGLERRAVDLRDAAARGAFLDELCRRFSRVLVITEGLLIYLKESDAAALAADLAARPSLRWWLLDFATPQLAEFLKRRWGDTLERANAPMIFFPADGPGYFTSRGFTALEVRYTQDEARRLGREMPLAGFWRLAARLMPRETRERYRTMSGYALLENKKEAV